MVHFVYNKVRRVFNEHNACAFKSSPKYLDCAVYMAEEIEKYVKKYYVRKKHDKTSRR